MWTPRSAPGTSEHAGSRRHAPYGTARGLHRCGGFTLIELLVVVVIVAVLAAVVGLALRPESDDRALRREGERLALLLEAVALESAATGRVLAWSHSGSAYRFWVRDPVNGWKGLEGDDLFRPRDFGAHAAVARVETDGRALEANERLVFRPMRTGDYVVELRVGASSLRLRGDPTGRVGIDDVLPSATR